MVQLLPQTYIVTKQMLNTEIKDMSFKTSGMGGGIFTFYSRKSGKKCFKLENSRSNTCTIFIVMKVNVISTKKQTLGEKNERRPGVSTTLC